jgi:hypothetical protein
VREKAGPRGEKKGENTRERENNGRKGGITGKREGGKDVT